MGHEQRKTEPLDTFNSLAETCCFNQALVPASCCLAKHKMLLRLSFVVAAITVAVAIAIATHSNVDMIAVESV